MIGTRQTRLKTEENQLTQRSVPSSKKGFKQNENKVIQKKEFLIKQKTTLSNKSLGSLQDNTRNIPIKKPEGPGVKFISDLKPGISQKRVGSDKKDSIPLDQFKKQLEINSRINENKSRIEDFKFTRTASKIKSDIQVSKNIKKAVTAIEETLSEIPTKAKKMISQNTLKIEKPKDKPVEKKIKKKNKDKFDNMEAVARGEMSFKEFKKIMEENETMSSDRGDATPKSRCSSRRSKKEEEQDVRVDAIALAHAAINRYKAVISPNEDYDFHPIEDKSYAREKLRSRILRQLFDECLDEVVREVNTNGRKVKKTVFQPYVEGMINDIEEACKELDTFESDTDNKILKNVDHILQKWKLPLSRDGIKELSQKLLVLWSPYI